MKQAPFSLMLFLFACGGAGSPSHGGQSAVASNRRTFTVKDTIITATFEASGVAQPVERAVLSTRLMGSLTEVNVREGDRVHRGQLLARIDAREVDAKRAQIDAGISSAEAAYQDAMTQAARFRALFADSAATRFQLEQMETGLARADAGLQAARASRVELEAVGAYANILAPFDGVVTRRFVDPGAFAAPGAPLLEVQDPSRLRVSVAVAPRVSAGLHRDTPLAGSIEGRPAVARLEGSVPSSGGAMYTVNAIVENYRGEFLPGSSATLLIPQGTRRAVLIPAVALIKEGDLTGVRLPTAQGSELRWVRVAPTGDDQLVEVVSGLRPGDIILDGSD